VSASSAARWLRSPAPLLVELIVFFAGFELCFQLLAERGWAVRSVLRPGHGAVYRIETPAMLIACAVAFFVLFPALRVWRGGWGPRDFGFRCDGWGAALRIGGVLLGLELVLSFTGLLVIPGLPAQLWAAYGHPDGYELLVLLLLVVPVGAALGEEIVYRGYLQGGLQCCHRAWGPVIAALVFAGLHAFQGVVPLLLFHVPSAIVFVAAYRRTGNLVVMILVHLLFDLIVFAAIWLLAGPPGWSAALPGVVLAGALALLLALWRAVVDLFHEVVDLLVGLRSGWVRGVLWAVVIGALFLVAREQPWASLGRWDGSTSIALPLALLLGGLAVLVVITRVERRGDQPSRPR